jgi:homoserine dehydrogenase
MKRIRTILIGLGTVNIGLLKILKANRQRIAEENRLDFSIVGVADSSGVAIKSAGYDYDELIMLKSNRKKANELDGYIPEKSTENIAELVDADLLIESSAGNLKTGNPGLQVAREALTKGCSVVFANKVPLVFAYDELHQLSRKHGGKIAFSATVCGGLPVINVLQRDLKFAQLKSFRGILNATTNYILKELYSGGSWEDAIKEAQRLGAAEADPSYDVNGHDTANKLFIIMKSFTDFNGAIADIETMGIQYISEEDIQTAMKTGNVIKLIALAEKNNGQWKLSARPTEIKENSFLGTCNGWEMGIELETDLYESIAMKNYEADPVGTSAAVLRDIIDVSADRY